MMTKKLSRKRELTQIFRARAHCPEIFEISRNNHFPGDRMRKFFFDFPPIRAFLTLSNNNYLTSDIPDTLR